ncbi:hypothetical protein GRF29_1g3240378 [Pseudopithomyces chartarum]|uniref:Exosome complex protein n=1 Tax=Pseudopithomyces chartarum TaxID=1892770 RepID=A0AAN6M8Y2_9PLEO|nr:hypothetical protein GRF29_1g3240378 [Pseudopithomyces chartarum]
MDPETNLPDLTDDLADTIDDLSSALSPLLSTPLHTLTSTLPTLDKAKFHILTAYTIESLFFQALQASGADAKSHRVFAEIARLKNYYAKVKAAEAAGEGKGGPTTKLDKDAAARFIRHGLAGNERYDREREERVAKEKARAALKARKMAEKVNRKFDDGEEERVQVELGRKRKAEAREEEKEEDSSEEEEVLTGLEEQGASAEVPGSEEDHVDSENADFYGEEKDVDTAKQSKKAKKEKKDKKSNKRRKSDMNANTDSDSKAKGKHSRASKKGPEMIIPERGTAPRSHSETFNALLSGGFAEQKNAKKDRKKKAKKA